MKSLTVAYITCRSEPKIQWFYDSLKRQVFGENLKRIIVVDRLRADELFEAGRESFRVLITKPKPNVWQGEHRLTKEDWFAAANARNTALCLCDTDYIAYVDDLSVLTPSWLNAVNEAMAGGYVACGAYQKVKNLIVDNGMPITYESGPEGKDVRFDAVREDVSPCNGNWLFGCSVAMPVEDLLQVGGWPEYCDSLGSEDYCLGHALRNLGKELKYDRRMLTLEADDLHHIEPSLKRRDKGVSPNDKSHAALRLAQMSFYFANYYPGSMRALREHVLAGNPFPVIQEPKHDWYDSQLISEME